MQKQTNPKQTHAKQTDRSKKKKKLQVFNDFLEELKDDFAPIFSEETHKKRTKKLKEIGSSQGSQTLEEETEFTTSSQQHLRDEAEKYRDVDQFVLDEEDAPKRKKRKKYQMPYLDQVQSYHQPEFTIDTGESSDLFDTQNSMKSIAHAVNENLQIVRKRKQKDEMYTSVHRMEKTLQMGTPERYREDLWESVNDSEEDRTKSAEDISKRKSVRTNKRKSTQSEKSKRKTLTNTITPIKKRKRRSSKMK